MYQHEIDNLLANPNHHIFISREFELKPTNIAKYICAISNTDTGYIIIGAVYTGKSFIFNGISKKFNFKNVIDESKKLLSQVPNIEYQIVTVGNCDLLFIKVEKCNSTNTYNGEKYKLEGTEIIKCKGDIIMDTTKVFIVHGHDNEAKQETARFIEKLGLQAIILHEQANKGKTIIEKIEENSNVGFAVVLYTPCDEGKAKTENTLKYRARQNVVFEHGYLIGKIGRQNVCALVKGEIEKPNDISGVIYIDMDDKGAWKFSVVQELRSAGFQVDLNKALPN